MRLVDVERGGGTFMWKGGLKNQSTVTLDLRR